MRRITEFVALLAKEQKERIMKTAPSLGADYTDARHINGRKYAKVDVLGGYQWSGRYMVDMKTGEIFGIKAYGVIHKGHSYGTLDTIDDWHWGEYVGVKK